jgi:hypothetical protein
MAVRINQFQLILNHARSFGGYENVTSVADLEAWNGISKAYSSVEFSCRDKEQVCICIDWSPAVAYASKCKELYSRSAEEVHKTLINERGFFERSIVCSATVQIESDVANREPWWGGNYLRQLLYEIYLVANLSTPGCFNLYRSFIKVPGLDPAESPFAQTELELSEYPFEQAWHETQSTSWVKVGFLPFGDVYRWYKQFQLGLRQVAKSPVEKALFALLHLGRNSFLEPEATLWLASALEAIFDTPNGSSFHFLHKRISALLNVDSKQEATLKKQLREFYNVRNRFAHGGGEICHPIANEFGDPHIDQVSRRTIEANNFACGILLGSIQGLVLRNAAGFEFTETISGVVFRSNN